MCVCVCVGGEATLKGQASLLARKPGTPLTKLISQQNKHTLRGGLKMPFLDLNIAIILSTQTPPKSLNLLYIHINIFTQWVKNKKQKQNKKQQQQNKQTNKILTKTPYFSKSCSSHLDTPLIRCINLEIMAIRTVEPQKPRAG